MMQEKNMPLNACWHWLVASLSLLAVSSCSLAPTYKRPTVPTPTTYKESGKWIAAKPSSAALDRGPWWHMYHDTTLNNLENQIASANQNLKIAVARYAEARAELGVAQSKYFPTAMGVANSNRQQISGNVANKVPVSLYSDNLLAVNFNYELDVWGRVRNTVETARDLASASAADTAFIDLSLHAELAKNYFALRGDDDAQRVLDETVMSYQKALNLIRNRYKGDIASASDVDQAQTQLDSAKTQAEDMRLKRAELEHAIAVLIGQPPAAFSLPRSHNKMVLVKVAPTLPSTLLERRPDIAEAELKVQAANANIGVARAAFFPTISLSAAYGVDSASLGNLLSAPSNVWALGPTTSSALLNNGSMPLLSQIIYDGGRIQSLSDKAKAQYEETVAQYRQTVLTAYQEVEDSLVALRQLDKEYRTQSAASNAANRALQQAMYRYKGGLTTYLNVVVAQDKALQAELVKIDVRTRRQLASVQLIKALGGGWR